MSLVGGLVEREGVGNGILNKRTSCGGAPEACDNPGINSAGARSFWQQHNLWGSKRVVGSASSSAIFRSTEFDTSRHRIIPEKCRYTSWDFATFCFFLFNKRIERFISSCSSYEISLTFLLCFLGFKEFTMLKVLQRRSVILVNFELWKVDDKWVEKYKHR